MSTTKRKSDGAAGGSRTKKSKNAPDHTEAKELIDTVLGDGGALDASEARTVAEYARWLEGEVVAMKPKERSPEDIARAAEKLRSACVSGIKKQMTWKPSCKSGSAKWSYDGVCSDPAVFGSLLNLSGPPKWKMQKYTVPEFEAFMGSIEASVRYDSLELMANVTVRYQPDEGTFKMSGSYGAPRHIKD
ncbi:hypothetical protein B0H13DRAFT_2543841 [Mycena leptocephala]|nr:hypothetical protein B0H13DRAFT_2543841 [Mycena leptocephala]